MKSIRSSFVACLFASAALPALAGPDVVLKDIGPIQRFGELNGIVAYAFGNTACNQGDQNLRWEISGTPVMGMNLYRLKDGVLTQIGQSFAKRSLFSVASDGCGPCNGADNTVLGAGCQDTYNVYYNAAAGNLGPRATVNAYSGTMQSYTPMTGDVLFRRLQVPSATVDLASNAGALYFAEGVYVATDDAQAGNALNNASYRPVALGPNAQLSEIEGTRVGRPAIYAWRDHGMGLNVPDHSVDIYPVDVPGEGRFFVASKAARVGSLWRYDYAIFNLNSDISAGGFEVNFAPSVQIQDRGSSGPHNHSGEPASNDPWISWRDGDGSLRFRTQLTFNEDPSGNAVRWGTMRSFWLLSPQSPLAGSARVHLFKNGAVAPLVVPVTVPAGGDGAPPCDDIDFNNDGVFPSELDLLAFLQRLGGIPCTTCNDLDFNNDGVFPSDADLIAFLRVSAGGSC